MAGVLPTKKRPFIYLFRVVTAAFFYAVFIVATTKIFVRKPLDSIKKGYKFIIQGTQLIESIIVVSFITQTHTKNLIPYF